MSKSKTGGALAVVIGLVVAVVAVVALYFGIAASMQASAVAHENGITTAHRNNQQILGTYSSKIAEMVQVPAMARDDFIALTTAAMEGRYGPDGNQAVLSFVRENYPATMDATMYTRIQEEISAGRTKFEENQTLLLDRKRVYQTELGYMFKGAFYRHLGFPKINLADYDVITSSHSDAAFAAGKDDGLTLRPAAPAPAPAPTN